MALIFCSSSPNALQIPGSVFGQKTHNIYTGDHLNKIRAGTQGKPASVLFAPWSSSFHRLLPVNSELFFFSPKPLTKIFWCKFYFLKHIFSGRVAPNSLVYLLKSCVSPNPNFLRSVLRLYLKIQNMVLIKLLEGLRELALRQVSRNARL